MYEALFWFYRYCHRQEVHSSITGEHNNRGSKNKELDEFKRYLQEKELSLSLKCGNVRGVDFKQFFVSRKISLTDVQLQLTVYWKKHRT